MKGTYIILEGVVGTGKTTQATNVYEYLKNKFPNKKVVLTREPGGTEIAEAIRKLVQGTKFEEKMDPVCEAYLYASARAQLLRNLVRPVLDQGGIVISDRSFISSLAYQGYTRGIGINKVLKINKTAIENTSPDLILFLKLDPQIGLNRSFDKEGDKFEQENVDFFKKIEQGYIELSEMQEFKDNWVSIDANGDQETVFNRIIQEINKILH